MKIKKSLSFFFFFTCFIVVSNSLDLKSTRDYTDRFLTIQELVESRGYRFEEHHTTTKDGYVLTLHRVINPLLSASDPKPVAFLQHGFFDSSITWLVADAYNDLGDGKVSKHVGNSFGFVLARRGYDVWLGNFRGNTYSMGRVGPHLIDFDYFKFKYDDHVDYDLPAMFDYVLKTTGRKRIAYVGHSLGGSIPLAMLTQTNRYNEIVKPILIMSPDPYANSSGNLLDKLAHEPVIELLKAKPILSYVTDNNHLYQGFLLALCGIPASASLCIKAFTMMTNQRSSYLRPERINAVTAHFPAGTSTWFIAQKLQFVMSNEYKRFDYGTPGKNQEMYGQSTPPKYDIQKITTKHLGVWYLEQDSFSELSNVILFSKDIKGN